MKLKSTLFSVAFILIAFMVFAQAPEMINYQAIVRNAQGNPEPANTPVALTFIIHQGSTTGTIVFNEVQHTTTNAFGLVTAQIGSVTSLALVSWGSGTMYLEVQASINGGTNTSLGTSQLISVPYALYAANSAPGPTGSTGVPGPTGLAGATGNNGADGATGLPGVAGPTGATGNNGAVGATGATGNPGTAGVTGPTGTAGNNGNNGATGATGNPGAPGLTGPTGNNGATGNAGSAGATGPTGATGNDGAAGATGNTGPSGNNGTAGATGATGATGVLTAGTATGNTTYWDGTQWVVNSGFLYNNGTAVGIGGVPTSTYALQVFGRLKTNGFNETSDIRLKKNISTLGSALATVLQLRGVSYNWKTQAELDKEQIPAKSALDPNNPAKPEIGFIAQEIEKVLPGVVITDKDGFKSVEYSKLVALLVEALKEQQATIDQLKAANNTGQENYKALENETREMRASIKALQDAIGTSSVK